MTSTVLLVVAVVLLGVFSVASFTAWRRTEALRTRLDVLDMNGRGPEDEDTGMYLAEAVDAIDDGIVIVDRSGTVRKRNAAAARFHDARHAEAVVEQAIDELLTEALEGNPVQRELQLYGPPPETLLLRGFPLREGAVVVGAVVFIRDMSEVRRIDEVRRDFVSNVSHELKTPIGALTLLAETLVSSDDDEIMRQLAERVLGEADRLGRIVDDLLDLSLIESNDVSAREPVPVERIIHEAVDRVRPVADDRGIAIVVGAIDAERTVMCDHQRVTSAVTNLLDNAVKYSEAEADGDHATVRIEAVHEGDRLAITVQDHGIGIPTRDLERIFERFYRVDRARSRATGGTGIGLSIVRHVAQAHGGEVTVESREGEGSTFRFVLPDRPLRAVPGIAEAS